MKCARSGWLSRTNRQQSNVAPSALTAVSRLFRVNYIGSFSHQRISSKLLDGVHRCWWCSTKRPTALTSFSHIPQHARQRERHLHLPSNSINSTIMVTSIRSYTAAVALLAAAVCIQDAHAHVYLTEPLAEFKSGTSKSSWIIEFPPPWEGSFKTGALYAAAAKAKGIKDLRSYLEDKGPACGNSLPNAKPKAIPSNGRISLASTIEHAGPCEVWLDDVMAFHDDDCESTFGSATSFAVDFSSCKGPCMLRFYWLGLQASGRRWQVYKNCVPLAGNGGSSSGGSTTTKPATTKAPSPDTPATPDAPSAKPATTTAPKATKAPVASDSEVTKAPAPPKPTSACKRLRD